MGRDDAPGAANRLRIEEKRIWKLGIAGLRDGGIEGLREMESETDDGLRNAHWSLERVNVEGMKELT